jgi:rhodanese-related sulfurtransferase
MPAEISPREFVRRRAAGEAMVLLDVREGWELKLAAVPSAVVHIPMGDIAARLGELDPAADTVVICRSGGRSGQVASFLERQGFAKVTNLSGGILAWAEDLDPSIARY